MRCLAAALAAALMLGAGAPALAAEGPSIAGPIGGTDVRSALLPPPGLYGGAIVFGAEALRFVDGQGHTIPPLSGAYLVRATGGPFAIWVPDVQVFGGQVGVGAFFPGGHLCGHLFAGERNICQSGFGDPYVEVAWSRFYGTVRPSRDPGALPILQGLTVLFGFGTIVPIGQFNPTSPLTKALSSGTNIWDFAPNVAVTYTTAPLFAEGTEISAKAYLNNYLENPDTGHKTGRIVNVDFAISERIGRWQVGLAGIYAVQLADDKQNGVRIPPDGQRAMTVQLGPVVVYDMPEFGAALKIKALKTVIAENTVHTQALVFGVFKKFRCKLRNPALRRAVSLSRDAGRT